MKCLLLLTLAGLTAARPQGTATGQSLGTLQTGTSGQTAISDLKLGTGGTAQGSGINFGTSTGFSQNTDSIFGSTSTADIKTDSVQTSGPNFGLLFPGTATGQSTLQITKGTSPGGTVTSISSGSGGTATNGGTSISSSQGTSVDASGLLGSTSGVSGETSSVQIGGR